MSFFFGSQKTPQLNPVAPPPVTDDNAIKKEEEKKLKQGKTARPTLMTGPQGLLEPAPVAKKTLLGE